MFMTSLLKSLVRRTQSASVALFSISSRGDHPLRKGLKYSRSERSRRAAAKRRNASSSCRVETSIFTVPLVVAPTRRLAAFSSKFQLLPFPQIGPHRVKSLDDHAHRLASLFRGWARPQLGLQIGDRGVDRTDLVVQGH